MTYKKPILIAEIGCNHRGEFDTALELIKLAKECGASVAKFQKRHNKELLSEEQYSSPHPNPINSYGSTYGEHREFLEFTLDQHKELQSYCNKIHIEYSSSVWDVTSAKEMISINPSLIKVPSAINTNFNLLETLRDAYKGEIHISLGMTTREEEKKIIDVFSDSNSNVVIYSCTSGYPVKFNDVCLLEIKRLISEYKENVFGFGFSGHHLGIAIDNAAYTLGATWIERHFTKDRTWKGTDHAASLEPAGLTKLFRDLNATYECLTIKKSEILDVEIEQRKKLKFKEE